MTFFLYQHCHCVTVSFEEGQSCVAVHGSEKKGYWNKTWCKSSVTYVTL